MSPGSSTESYPAFAHIGLRENPGKNLNQVTCPDRDSNPGHLVSRPDMLTVTPQHIGVSEEPLGNEAQRQVSEKKSTCSRVRFAPSPDPHKLLPTTSHHTLPCKLRLSAATLRYRAALLMLRVLPSMTSPLLAATANQSKP
ncbi:hypothetical protein ANN_06110 [Periplaneta americana]|uniref:Uncharacterized protein n=1 Tax=Periplaneta americana TaxID=6978 RepID=A0ABQ8TEE4_PERAM|nr:hypothetical protein ANN_06110 [Periplaneta americana]